MRSKVSFNKNQVQVLPFTLLPSSFPKKHFEKVKDIQMLLNELIHKVAHNNDFLIKSLKRYIRMIYYLYLYLYVLYILFYIFLVQLVQIHLQQNCLIYMKLYIKKDLLK